jgi:N-acetylglucosamine malate deacetylase 1
MSRSKLSTSQAPSASVDVLAVGAHPDDVELGCGGTLAQLSAAGYRIGIAHLTRGEAGTRGSAAQRVREAERSAEILDASLHWLDFGDGGLRAGVAEEDELIDLLRELTPRVVLAPPPRDRHPDHERAHRLVREAAFYAGLVKRGEGSAHRPRAMWSYTLHHPFEPSFIVDISSSWASKCAALDAYESQLYALTGGSSSGPATMISSPEFRASIEGRARHYGQLIGAAFGEPFHAETPPGISAARAVEDLA